MAPSHHGHTYYQLTPIHMSQYHEFKEQQYAPRPEVVDPLGLLPKTCEVASERPLIEAM